MLQDVTMELKIKGKGIQSKAKGNPSMAKAYDVNEPLYMLAFLVEIM